MIGSALLKQLLQHPNYKQIRSISRRPLNQSHPKLVQKVIDFDQLHEIHNFFAVDEVFCCLGTTMKKAKSKDNFRKVDYQLPIQAAKLAKEAGVKQFLIVTAMGANKQSLFFYNRVKGEVEEALHGIAFPSIHIFRPSLLLGHRRELRLAEKIAGYIMKPLSFLMIGPLAKYQAIEATTVAYTMIQVANQQLSGQHLYLSDQIKRIATQG